MFELTLSESGASVAAATAVCLNAALGAWWPLRRAARIDPVIALREE